MESRIDYGLMAPDGIRSLRDLASYLRRKGLEPALAWTDAVIRIGQGIPDLPYEDVHRHFREKELADPTLAVVAINAWNRLAIAFRTLTGSYRQDLAC